MKILILDDDKICRRVNSEGLRRAGYDTLEAASAKEAFELLEKGEPVVMIVTDIMMPETSGLDFLGRLRENLSTARIPVLISTCIEPDKWLAKAESLGISGHSPKPINANHLRGIVGKILQEEPWPLAEVSRTLMRLDLSVENYFECLDDFIRELEEVAVQTNESTERIERTQLIAELSALSGAAANLGAIRIVDVLDREIEMIKKTGADEKTSTSSSLKRETSMLKLASLVIKKEKDLAVAERKAGRVVSRQSNNQSRWKARFVAQGPVPPDALSVASSEAAPNSSSTPQPDASVTQATEPSPVEPAIDAESKSVV